MAQMQNVIAVIPARGGSKGIPGKNIRMLRGKPLVAWSIEQAQRTPQISRVLVSTDSTGIAMVARNYEAEVIERPPHISGDTASSESALLHALDQLQKNEGREPDLVVFLQATSPSRHPRAIQAAIETLERENADSLLSVGPVHGFVWRVEQGGPARSFSYDHLHRPRRQDAPEDLIENGSIYIFKPWVLRQFNNRLGGKIALHRMSALDSFQIDEPGDFELLEHLMAFQSAGHTVPGAELCRVKLLALDFDGVMTDNRVLVMEDGKEAVLCNRGDGLGLGMLKTTGVKLVVLSKERNPVVGARCRKLGIDCIQGCDDKLAALQVLCLSLKLDAGDVAYMGNDVNDLECLRWVGLPIAVADATAEVLAVARLVTAAAGGQGAVREVCDLLIRSNLLKPDTKAEPWSVQH